MEHHRGKLIAGMPRDEPHNWTQRPYVAARMMPSNSSISTSVNWGN